MKYSRVNRLLLIALIYPFCAYSQQPSQEPAYRIRVDVIAKSPAGEKWIEIDSRNFRVVGNVSEEQLRRVTADFELFREQVALLLPRARLASSAPTTVVVLRDHDGAGYLQSGEDVNYIVLNGGKPPRDVYYKYVHLLLRDSTVPLPLWFEEGVAKYYSTFQVSWLGLGFGSARWIQVGGRDKELNKLLTDKVQIPLAALFQFDRNAHLYSENARHNAFYATSWAVVRYLQARQRERLSMFFDALAKGDPAVEAFSMSSIRALPPFKQDSKPMSRTAETEAGLSH